MRTPRARPCQRQDYPFGRLVLIPIVTFLIEFLIIKKVPALIKDGRVFAIVMLILVVIMSIVILKWLDSDSSRSTASIRQQQDLSIGVGGAFGLIMLLNVWGIIWPNNKRIIGALTGGPPAAPELARQAFIASRTNTWLSLPMLLFMGTSTAIGRSSAGIRSDDGDKSRV